MNTGFWTRHFGRKPPLVLGAAALLGGALGIALSWASAERQRPYPARQGEMTWTQGAAVTPSVQALLELGRESDRGRWDPARQAQALRCSGLDVQNTFLVSMASQASQPNGWLSLPDVSTPFQVGTARGWLEDLAQATPTINTQRPCREHDSWQDPQWQDVVQVLLDPIGPDEQAWHEAREHLRQRAQHQQLAQLILSASLQGTEDFRQAAAVLDRAGSRLERATGQDWGLGLEGRIALFLVPHDTEDPMAGMTRTRPHTRNGAGVVDVVAETTSSVLLHEWFHGLDLVAAPAQTRHALAGMAWSNQRSWLGSTQGPIAQAWGRASEVLDKQQSWAQARRKLALEDRTLYWLDEAETMAYAFEAWADHDLDRTACIKNDAQMRHGARPTPAEAACLAQAWGPSWSGMRSAINQP